MGESTDPVERGRKVWEIYCKSCHTIDGAPGIGPTWLKPDETEVLLSDGTRVPFDDEYILRSIIDPNAQLVEGFAAGTHAPKFLGPID